MNSDFGGKVGGRKFLEAGRNTSCVDSLILLDLVTQLQFYSFFQKFFRFFKLELVSYGCLIVHCFTLRFEHAPLLHSSLYTTGEDNV